MIKFITPNEKAKVTLAIKSLLSAKQAEKAAKEAVKSAEAVLLSALNGDDECIWKTDEHTYRLSATYGKTRRTLSAELVEEILGVKVTEKCYKKTAPWNELRVNVVV